MKKQQGFTLIELMIVVAIIGILAAIALPAYQDYTARAQAAEALTLTAGLRTDIAERKALGVASMPDAASLSGKYVQEVAWDADGDITVTFKSTGVAGDLAGEDITLDFDEVENRWTCSIGTGLEKYLPSGCKP